MKRNAALALGLLLAPFGALTLWMSASCLDRYCELSARMADPALQSPYPWTRRSVAAETELNGRYAVVLTVVGVLTCAVGGMCLWLYRRWAPLPGGCAACGYDLRATPARCPECGAEGKPTPGKPGAK